MFDIGFWEMLIIGVMALLILGPERLPGAIRSTISTIRSIKDVANGFKQEVSSQLDAHELHANLKKAESLGMGNIGKDLQKSVDELKAAAASVQQPYKTSPKESDEAITNSKVPEAIPSIEKSSGSDTETSDVVEASSEKQEETVRKQNNE
jgi:sec-independent protein translocase protein TatB